jgi:hypothetical protein
MYVRCQEVNEARFATDVKALWKLACEILHDLEVKKDEIIWHLRNPKETLLSFSRRSNPTMDDTLLP